MFYNKQNFKRTAFTALILTIFAFSAFYRIPGIQNNILSQNRTEKDSIDGKVPQSSETDYYSKDWIKYGNFSTGASSWWSGTKVGDPTDFDLTISGGEANYIVKGEHHVKKFDDPIDTTTASNWVAFNKSEPAINPDTYTIDDDGFFVSHSWHDATPDQFTTISWRYNVSMGVDMTEYNITSASIDAIMNATVNANVDTPKDNYATYSPLNLINQAGIYDHAIFYVELADMQLTTFYRVLYNKTNDLGQSDVAPNILSYSDKSIEQVADEQDLIYYLTSLFAKDPGHDQLAIIVGIDIQCEDDYTGSDYDDWNALRIKSVNLTLSYDKNIDKLTEASWNQYGDTIPNNYIIDNATLNFAYKIDRDWAANTGSINSEFRIMINNNQLGETVKLTSGSTSYKDFKVGGLDVSNFITPNEDVNLSILVYIGDKFTLDSDITVSIDNVSLVINYGIFTPPDTTTYDLLLNNVNRTTEKSTQVTFNNNLNITLVYKNSTGGFIPSANVELTGGGLTPTTLTQGAFNNYYTILNSSDLGVGVSYLTLTASKRYYTTKQFQITIEVLSRDTEIQLFLDKNNLTDIKEWTTDWNKDLNITIKYLDIDNLPSTHISGAMVELTGVGATKNLIEDPGNKQYEITVNTSDIGVGSTFLTVYASKENYTSLNIKFKIVVSTRNTYLDNLKLDSIERISYEIAWNEKFDITVSYNDSITDNFIPGASVQLIGTDYSKTFSQSSQMYNLTVNTFDLSIGNNFLTVLAQKNNYSLASQLITIIVKERNTTITSMLNHTITNTIYYPHGEMLNITAIYNDESGPFIDGATVQLREGTTVIYTLTKPISFDQYSIEINTNDLNLGVNLLTLYAKKDNYSAAFESLTIIVDERDSSIDVLINGNPSTAYSLAYDEMLNITAIYKDFTGAFIDGATVELRKGESTLSSIPKHSSYHQYTLMLNTKNLSLGANLLAIYANKDNFSAALVPITITVTERDTDINVYLNGSSTTVIEIPYGDMVNITVVYSDSSGPFIDGATVELRNGTTLLNTLTKHPSLDQYYVIKDTSQLLLGSNSFSIYAKKDNYTTALVSILIIVVERDTSLDVYLNGNPTTAIDVTYGEDIDFVAIYKDYTNNFIDGATVELREGTTTINTFTKHPTLDQYNLTKNSNELNLGSNVFTIYAKKENYSVVLTSILITVNERNTTLNVLLNGIDSSTIGYYNISINQPLNITAVYEDFVPTFVNGALVKLTGSGVSETLAPHPIFSQYNYTLNLEDLGVGVHFLVVTAEKENYTSAVQNIKINVLERGSNLQLYINSNNLTSERYIAAEIHQTLNVSIYYTDSSDKSFVPGANVRLTGALNENLTENAILQYYNVSIHTDDLDQGINFLTIFAQKQGYVSKSIIFTIEVKEKASNLQLFLNGANETLGRSIEVVVGELVNVSVIYEDYEKNFINNAGVLIVGEGIDLNLTKHPIYNLYNVSIDSNDLNFGINYLTLYAKRDNYQPQTLTVTIKIIEKETGLQIFLNREDRTLQRSLTVPIRSSVNVTIKYFELDTNASINGASIQLLGEGLNVSLGYNPTFEQYSTIIDTSTQLDVGVRILTIYATRANYESFSAQLTLTINRIRTNITTVSGQTVVNRKPGQNYDLDVKLQDLDFNTNVLNATVTYTWAYGQGSLTDPNNDGIYTATISNLREGTFVITISVYAGDDYDFKRFTVTLNVVRPPEDVLLFQVLTIVGVGAAIGLGGYLFAYQKVLKYPKQVRKIRKYKSKLKKSKSLGLEARSRDQIIEDSYAEKIRPLEKTLKSKMGIKADTEKGPIEQPETK